MTQTVEYCEIVRAAHDTASKLLNRGQPKDTYSVSVNTHGGPTASVSWQAYDVTMCLPSFKPETRLTRAEADRIVGYIAHECCHVLHTQWKIWEQAVAQGPAIARLTNGIEDVRIEAAEIATGYLPNLRNVLSETLTAKHWEGVQKRKAEGLPPVGTVAADLSYVLCVLGRLANGYSVPCAQGLRASLPARFQPIVAYALKRMPKLANTRDALKLAIEIANRLAALPKPQQPAQPQQPGQPGKPQQPTPGEAQEGEEGPGASGEAQEGEEGPGASGEAQEGEEGPGASGEAQEGEEGPGASGEAQEGEEGPGASGEAQEGEEGPGASGEAQEGEEGPGASGEAQEAGDGTPGGTGAGGGGEPDLDAAPMEPDAGLDSLVRDAMERTGDTAESADLSPLNTFNGATRHPLPPVFGIVGGYAARLRAATPHPAKLRNQVAQIVRSQERHGHERFRSVGRMDRRSIARMAAGASNVYARRTFVPGVDTAVVVLIDGSGSMSGSMGLAHLMALHLAEAIEAARGKVCVAGFWGMADQVTLAIVKGFGDKFDASRLARFGVQQSTPLSVSILGAADLLREVHADRKIILVLTDGGCDLGPDVVQGAVAMVNRRGVECAGIGLGVDVGYAFPVNAQVNDPAQLATEGLATLVRAIETGRNRR